MILENQTIKNIVEYWAQHQEIPKEILYSVIWHESCAASEGRNVAEIINNAIYSSRPEPGFYGFYLKNRAYLTLAGYKPKSLPSPSSEKLLRAQSYGLTQIMGETARVLGFKGQYLNELFKPHINIEYGARWLGRYLHRTKSVEKALLRYNGGGDKLYPSKILKVKDSGTWKTLLNF
jgi:hypothetical protein